MVAATMPPTMTPVLATIDDTRVDLPSTVTIGLEEPESLAMPAPGQFAMLWVPGVGEVPISYSAIGPGRRVEHTIRAVGLTSAALAAMRPGDVVGVRGPFGRGWQVDDLADRDLLIVAGGLGLAPLRPVIEMAVSGAIATRSTRLLVGARSPGLVLYADQFEQRWSTLSPRLSVDAAPASWQGAVGPVTSLLDGAVVDSASTSALVCGPEIMMRMVCFQLVDAGIEPEAIHVSVERNMQCGIGVCGHCQLGPLFTCTDGPVVDWATAGPLLAVRER